RLARSEVRRSISQTRAEGARELLMGAANSAELCGLFSKARTEAARNVGPVGALVAATGLTETEALRIMFYQEAWWQYRAQIIQYIDDLSDGERAGFDSSLRQSYDGSLLVGAVWYKNRKSTLNPVAVRYVEN